MHTWPPPRRCLRRAPVCARANAFASKTPIRTWNRLPGKGARTVAHTGIASGVLGRRQCFVRIFDWRRRRNRSCHRREKPLTQPENRKFDEPGHCDPENHAAEEIPGEAREPGQLEV